MKGAGFKIRVRDRQNSSPKAGLRQSWSEYQVVSGTKVIARFELLHQAQKEYPGAELDSSMIHEDAIRAAASRKS
jgi:hypothetical protein